MRTENTSATTINVAKWVSVDPVEAFLQRELARQTKIADRAGEAYQIEGRKRRPSVKRLDALHAASMKECGREEAIAWMLRRVRKARREAKR